MVQVIITTLLQFGISALLVYGFRHEDRVIAFEEKLRRKIAKKLRSSERFMNWLYEPSISEQIEAEYNGGKVKIIEDWRN